jgi:hypothetical protein
MEITAFDQAWGVVKEYTLDWRRDAQDLLNLDPSELPKPEQDAENYGHRGLIDEGTKVATYRHPLDSRYVMKVPYSDDEWAQKISQGRNQNDDTMALLERLGYPIVGELGNLDRIDDISDTFFVQPRLELNRFMGDPDKKRLADTSLMHLINDRNMSNYGIDSSLGGVRNFDLDTIGFTDDWWPHEGHTRDDLFDRHGPMSRGEQLQEHLNTFGIQHPASRLLNEIPEVSHEDRDNPLYRLQSFRNLLEEIEPHSDNPKNLTVDGKPIWLEGLV